jgi:hypothetical protein
MVKQQVLGISLQHTVEQLSHEYHVTKSALYKDWKQRSHWQEVILGIQDKYQFFLDLLSTHKEIYQFAVKEYLTGDNSNARIGALRLLRDLNLDLEKMVVTKDLIRRVEQLEIESSTTTY